MVRILRETHEAPLSLQLRLAHAGGLNRFGEPNFRAVWGWSRLTWIGGKMDGYGRARERDTRMYRVAPGAEIFSFRAMAYRAMDAAGILWLTATVVCANDRARGRHFHSRAWTLPAARRLRALFHIARPGRRIHPAYTGGLRI